MRWIRAQDPVAARLHDRSLWKSEVDALGKLPSGYIHPDRHLIVQLHPLRLPGKGRMIVNLINGHHAICPLPHRGISTKEEEEGRNQLDSIVRCEHRLEKLSSHRPWVDVENCSDVYKSPAPPISTAFRAPSTPGTFHGDGAS